MKAKRIVSILLVIAMLLSLSLAIIPIGAETPEGYTAISDVAGLRSISNGKYYLTKDIEVPIGEKLNEVWHSGTVELDGGNHTITFADGTGDKSLFSGGGPDAHIIIKNLTIDGEVFIENTTAQYGPLVRHGCDGSLTLENVHSNVDITITGNIAATVGGLIGKKEGSGTVTFNNVSYTGNIDLLQAASTSTSWYASVGGIIGGISGKITVNMKDVNVGTETDKTTILLNGNSAFETYPAGGVIGYVSKDVTLSMTGGSFNGTIIIAEASTRYVGGIIGQVCAGATIAGFDVNADIEQRKPTTAKDNKSYNMIGGVLGAWSHEEKGELTINDCHFNGKINVDNSGYNGVQGIGGIVGALNPTTNNKEGTVIISNCTNNGDITALGADGKMIGGMVGQACRLPSLSILNCVNNGKLTSTGTGGWVAAGGMVGTYRTVMGGEEWAVMAGAEFIIRNCTNNAEVSSTQVSGGMLGRTLEISNSKIVFSIENCVNSVNISGKIAGGMFGGNEGTAKGTFSGYSFMRCVNEGAINATDGHAGGIAGNIKGTGEQGGEATVIGAGNSGTITGTFGAAGIIGTAAHAPIIKDSKTTTDKITTAADTAVSGCKINAERSEIDAYKKAIEEELNKASLTIDAEEYIAGRAITVVATGGPKAKLILYKAISLSSPIGEYMLNEGNRTSGVAHNLLDAYGKLLLAGSYVLKLVDEDVEKARVGFKVKTMGSIDDFNANVTYTPSTEYNYRAAGTITIECDAGNIPDSYWIYWGDANGKLKNFDEIGKILNVSSTSVSFEISDTNILVPEGADRILVYAKREANMSKTPSSAALSEGAGASDRFGEALTRFNVLSDIHITTKADAQSNKNFIKAMEDIIKNTPDTQGVFVNGDVAEWGEMKEYNYLDTILNTIKRNNNGYDMASKMFYGLGNHDLYQLRDDGTYEGAWNADSADGKIEITRTAEQNIMQFLKGTHNTTENGQEGLVYYDYWVNDMHFIFLGDEHVTSSDKPKDFNSSHPRRDVSAQLSTAQLDWFEKTIAEKKDGKEDNPVFVFLHQGIKNTVAGTLADELGQNWHGVDGEDANRIKAIMKKNPNAIMFAGHSHWALGEYKTMVLANGNIPTTFNTGAIKDQSATGNDGYAGASGYYVTVYKDKIVFEGRDFYNSEWISNSQLVIDWTEHGEINVANTISPTPTDDPEGTEPIATYPIIDDGDKIEPEKKKGCGSSIGITSALVTVMICTGAAFVYRKKKIN